MVEPRPLVVARAPFQAEGLSAFVTSSMGLVWQVLRAAGLRGGANVAVYRPPFMEAGVEADFDPEPPLLRSSTPGGRAWTAPSTLAELSATNAALREACADEWTGLSWEVYGHADGRLEVFYQLR